MTNYYAHIFSSKLGVNNIGAEVERAVASNHRP